MSNTTKWVKEIRRKIRLTLPAWYNENLNCGRGIENQQSLKDATARVVSGTLDHSVCSRPSPLRRDVRTDRPKRRQHHETNDPLSSDGDGRSDFLDHRHRAGRLLHRLRDPRRHHHSFGYRGDPGECMRPQAEAHPLEQRQEQ